MKILSHLEEGYPTLTHGDVHPGNLIADGEIIWIVDWSYACNSLNLFDLDYVQSVTLPPSGPIWSVIQPPDADDVLKGYFHAAGLPDLDFRMIHKAVMVWDQLRTYNNGVRNGYLAEAEYSRERLLELI